MIQEFKEETPREIAQFVDFKDVQRSLQYYYPGSKWNSAKKVFARIKNAPKKKQKDPKERIELYAGTSIWGDTKKKEYFDSYHSIHTIELGTDRGEEVGEVWGVPKNWSMSFRPWDELSNIKIYEETFKHYTLSEILAFFIYEIAWYGTESRMMKRKKILYDKVKNIVKDSKK